MKKKIELLAPARNADIGIEAIRHGADAVYIGASDFGARSAAANSSADIARLCSFAHIYGAKVYVTMNTLLYDNELHKAQDVAWQMYEAGVDALIVQDMALLKMDLPPIPLHASTQCDIRDAQKALMLEEAGFEQLVLARELSIEEIAKIASTVSVPLEAFVHGALCVSFSGQCYASEYAFGRSANRGQCAQFCRLPFDLLDGNGNCLVEQKHLLSLRDMNRSAYIKEMILAGISSFKIEGRLKDGSYVKNITAYYRQCIDQVLAMEDMRHQYTRSSAGQTELTFQPQPEKSFNRGFTEYLLHGKKMHLHDFDTPKAKGEPVGHVVQVLRNSFVCSTPLHPGDGICFIDRDGKLNGFRVNRCEGNEVFPARMPRLRQGEQLFRNHDQAFELLLNRPSATRRMNLWLKLSETPQGYRLEATDELGRQTNCTFDCKHESAQTPQRENIAQQLSKLGNTPYRLAHFDYDIPTERFIPSSWISAWKREVVDALLQENPQKGTNLEHHTPTLAKKSQPAHIDYLSNVANKKAAAFYRERGAEHIDEAYELAHPTTAALMFCSHCIRRAYGMCLRKDSKGRQWTEPLSLRLADGRCFPLHFDCARCQMIVKTPRHD